MTNMVQNLRLAVYSGTNSADILDFLDGTGDPGTTWHVGYESGGSLLLQNKLAGVLQFEFTLVTGGGVTRWTGTNGDFINAPWSPSALTVGLVEVPTLAELQALDARVTALEGAQ